ncbi:hypothetical protein M2444_004638 [Paenibacillus sp. PastF-3]|uniref:hypothetical protein n=1 Tax=unclassified Paenibacillus TaxID=185978 RepID=UPI000BA107BB|nr:MULTISPECIES: hypothetical protein [unclassified Paenibacillus]MBY3621218.1 hypothetical protein [Acinetobacter sp. CUI P1]MDH6372809.1 hypothetical protein [Paenibacillus sp. PastF-3]OZQ97384.1 hypothetical protein CA598_06210 [Paenibacillus sp. VTT E-133291]
MESNGCLIQPLQQLVEFTDDDDLATRCASLSTSSQEILIKSLKEELRAGIGLWVSIIQALQAGGEDFRIEIQEQGGLS